MRKRIPLNDKSPRRSRPIRIKLERLELRMLLHADGMEHADLTDHEHSGTEIAEEHDSHHDASAEHSVVPAEHHDHGSHLVAHLDADRDDHITPDQFNALSEIERAAIDPHLIHDPALDSPVDFDELLGKPSGSFGPEAATYPDFFPRLNGSISLDQTTQPGRTLVRFGTQVNNQGTGPAILISGRPGIDSIPSGAPITSWTNPDGSQNVLQAVYDYNGSSFTLSHYLAAGQFTYHTGHGHFHFDGYAYYRLRQNVAGQPGPYVQRADGTDVVGEKVGFCLINILGSFTTEAGQSSTALPGYNASGQVATGCGLLQGVHVGKADVYSSGLEGQWIDVTGVSNGSYFLEIELDGEHTVTETNDNNNTKSFAFTLNANPPSGGIPADVYDLAGDNDTFANATNVGVMGTATQTGLTIHWGQDSDYFKFVASTSGAYTVTSSQANGNVDLYLYDAQEQQIGASTKASGSESISYNFVAGETYYLMTEAYNSTTSSNYQVGWNLKPLTESATVTATINESGLPGSFTITRNGPTTSPLTVNFTLTGTAQNGVDYQLVANSVSLGDLQSTATISIVPIVDSQAEVPETVILTISSNSAYVVGTTGSQIVIRDARTIRELATRVGPESPSLDSLRPRSDADIELPRIEVPALRSRSALRVDSTGTLIAPRDTQTPGAGTAALHQALWTNDFDPRRDARFGFTEFGLSRRSVAGHSLAERSRSEDVVDSLITNEEAGPISKSMAALLGRKAPAT